MTEGAKDLRHENLVGSMWMVVSMAAFAVEDALLKHVMQVMPVAQVLMIFGIGGAILFAGIARSQNAPLWSRDVYSPPMLIRVFFEVLGRLFYLLAVALIPLSSATVILQATPIVVVLAAAIVFGERVGPRRWIAILIGLIGVILIVKPGTEAFSPLSMLAVLGLLGFAGRDLASRAAPASLHTSILGLYGFLSVILAGALYSTWEQVAFVWPNAQMSVVLLLCIICGVFAYSSLMKAMRTGEVSAVTPLRYTRLLFGVGLGVVMFGEKVDATMLLGGGLIVLSGLFILWRKRAATT